MQYVDSTHLALYDTSGNAIAGTGDWWNGRSPYPGGVQTAQWIAHLTKFISRPIQAPWVFWTALMAT